MGLILSEFEGACYSSSEYLLCGIPVVSTFSFGGRDIWYNSYNSIICNPTPEAVSDAVKKLSSYNRDPHRIRQMHINLAKTFRANFINMLRQILVITKDKSLAEEIFINNYKHKLLTSETPNFEIIFN